MDLEKERDFLLVNDLPDSRVLEKVVLRKNLGMPTMVYGTKLISNCQQNHNRGQVIGAVRFPSIPCGNSILTFSFQP